MGRPKSALPLGTGTVLSTVALRLLSAGVDRLVIVFGHEAESVRAGAQLPEDPRLVVVVNSGWAEGMASSLRAGLEASEGCAAVVLALGDEPGIDPEVIGRLTAAWHRGARIAAVSSSGRFNHPILFDASLFPDLRRLSGDVGARAIVKAHWDEVVPVEGPPLHDLDTPADYETFVAGLPVAKDQGIERP
jgi:molybdenum cofactor cytidylyltransferase